MHVRIQSENGETRVEVMRDHAGLSGLMIGFVGPFGGLMATMMLASAAGMGPGLPTFAAMATGVVGGARAAWVWYRRAVARSRVLMEQIMDEVSRETRALRPGFGGSADDGQRALGAPSADADSSPDR